MAEQIPEKASLAAKRLAELRDELRLQIHLAGMETKDLLDEDVDPELEKLWGRLEAATQAVGGTADDAELRAHLLLMEARDRWETLSSGVRHVVEDIKHRGKRTREKLDMARVKAHLAKLDAEDEVEDRRKTLQEKLKQARDVVLQESAGMLDDLAASIEKLRKEIKPNGAPAD